MERSPLHPRTLAEQERAARLAHNRRTLEATCAEQRIAVDPRHEDLWDNVCLFCLKGGCLLLCETDGCFLSAHAECLGLHSEPRGAFRCPVCTPGEWPANVPPMYKEPLDFLKFHCLTHARVFVRLFGALKNLRVDHLEAYHKLLKLLYRLCNRVTDKVNDQVAKLLQRDSQLCTLRCFYALAAQLDASSAHSVAEKADLPASKTVRIADRTRRLGLFRGTNGLLIPYLEFPLAARPVLRAKKQLADEDSHIVPLPFSGAYDDDEETDSFVIGGVHVRQVQDELWCSVAGLARLSDSR